MLQQAAKYIVKGIIFIKRLWTGSRSRRPLPNAFNRDKSNRIVHTYTSPSGKSQLDKLLGIGASWDHDDEHMYAYVWTNRLLVTINKNMQIVDIDHDSDGVNFGHRRIVLGTNYPRYFPQKHSPDTHREYAERALTTVYLLYGTIYIDATVDGYVLMHMKYSDDGPWWYVVWKQFEGWVGDNERYINQVPEYGYVYPKINEKIVGNYGCEWSKLKVKPDKFTDVYAGYINVEGPSYEVRQFIYEASKAIGKFYSRVEYNPRIIDAMFDVSIVCQD